MVNKNSGRIQKDTAAETLLYANDTGIDCIVIGCCDFGIACSQGFYGIILKATDGVIFNIPFGIIDFVTVLINKLQREAVANINSDIIRISNGIIQLIRVITFTGCLGNVTGTGIVATFEVTVDHTANSLIVISSVYSCITAADCDHFAVFNGSNLIIIATPGDFRCTDLTIIEDPTLTFCIEGD